MRLYFIACAISVDNFDQFAIAPSKQTALDLWAQAWDLDARERATAHVFEIKAAKVTSETPRLLDWDGADIVRVHDEVEH
ncbi:hypothetical protein [Hyphomicrobium sp. 99]|uniref:hypothetical protein n=1 Tax=Hyphomicrobium sp. 99 TaxID=1163419 RepID=UPI0005F77067|nr:hypothetical protein [Hyphomicrobium sp. 99]